MALVKTWVTKKGESFVVDDEDFEWVKHFKWFLIGRQPNNAGGAIVMQSPMSLGRMILFSELLKRIQINPHIEVDHINGNPFDNRRENLRLVSRSENMHYKWKRIALRRLKLGKKCSLKCPNLATTLVRLPERKYLYLCDQHVVTTKRNGHIVRE